MNKTYAVDVVIRPSEKIETLAREISQAMWSTSPFIFDDTHFPHMTMAMGYIQDVETAKKVLTDAMKTVDSFTVNISGITHGTTPLEGYTFNFFAIEKSPELQQVHEYLMNNLPFVDIPKDADTAYFVPTDEVISVPATIDYVNSFKSKSSFQAFWPHITLPAGEKERLLEHTVKFPLTFPVDALSLFQLGNFCTCRKLL